jgi:hypothetical protein
LRSSQFHSFLPSEHDTLLIGRSTVNGFIAGGSISGPFSLKKRFAGFFSNIL